MKNFHFLLLASILLFIGCGNDDDDCIVGELIVTPGDCVDNMTYALTLDFTHENASDDQFEVYVRNSVLVGTYDLPQLPLTIPNFPISGLEYDFLKVCIHDDSDCCKEWEWMPPSCNSVEPEICVLSDLEIEVEDCEEEEGSFELEFSFNYEYPGADSFAVSIRNEVVVGTFALSDLPLEIEDFPISGLEYELIAICILGNEECCLVEEFMAACETEEDCEISEIETVPGDCNDNGTYALTIDFEYENAGNDYFDVWVRNNEYIGYFELEDLPLAIEQFPLSSLAYDFIRICINDNPDCCIEWEWIPPEC